MLKLPLLIHAEEITTGPWVQLEIGEWSFTPDLPKDVQIEAQGYPQFQSISQLTVTTLTKVRAVIRNKLSSPITVNAEKIK